MVSLPSERSTRFGNPAWLGFKTANFAAFGAWSGVLPKNAESLRDSDALMRVAVPKASRPRRAAQLFRASAGPLKSVAIAFALWYDNLGN